VTIVSSASGRGTVMLARLQVGARSDRSPVDNGR
jgi:hypothetical protein